MFSAIYIDLSGKKDYFYEKEFLTEIKKLFPEVVTLDIDIQSEQSLVEYTIKLLKDSERSVIMIEPGEKISPSIFSIFELVGNTPLKYSLILKDKNERIEALFIDIPRDLLLVNVPLQEALTKTITFFKNAQ